ncbi:MAG: VWA domain-containing protein [Anaerolineae bacterium]|nr:VWA domain-containing protein [Anaerolineae bacterium]
MKDASRETPSSPPARPRQVRGIVTAILAVALLFSFSPSLSVGAQGPVNVTIDHLNMDGYPDMKVLVTVRDANGIPILDLAADSFELIEDGRVSFQPAEVATQVNPDAVVSVMLVIDVSGSMRGQPIEEAKRAANAFVDKLNAADRAAIIAFSDEIDLDNMIDGKEIGFTTDKNALRNLIDQLDTRIGWDTPLYDAIYKGLNLTSKEPAGRRVVIVMTDGRDERDNAKGTPVPDAGSRFAPDDPINEATRQGIPVFTIGVGGKIDSDYLFRLAARTGGQYQETPNAEELTTLFQNVLDQLKQQYHLAYTTGLAEDSSYHDLMVRAHTPQGSAFDDVKFWLGAEAVPTALVVSGAVPDATAAPAPPPSATPEPTAAGIIDKVKEQIEDNLGLSAAIGGGALLLIILVVVLLVILLRGRKAKQAAVAASQFEEPYVQEPAMPPGVGAGAPPPFAREPDITGVPRSRAAAPTSSAAAEDGTVVGWGEPAPGGWPPASPVGGEMRQPGSPFGPPPAGAPLEGTRVIERAPKHLGMLVNKARPDQKHDLKGTMNVGRAPDNQIVVDHPTISRHHGWIKEDKGEFVVFDIGSANGTFVNGEQIEAPHRLESGDIIRFGEVEFVFTKVF